MVRKPSILILGSANTVQGPQAHLEELGCDIRTAHKAAASNCSIAADPLRPSQIPAQLESTSKPNGVEGFVDQLKAQNKLQVLDWELVTATGEVEANPEGLETAVTAALEELASNRPRAKHFFTKVGNKLRRIHLNDVRFIEVEGKYSAIHVGERKYNVKASLKDLLLKLPQEDFVRVSRNFVINIDRVTHIDTFQFVIKIDQDEIPISRTYKDELMKRIQLL